MFFGLYAIIKEKSNLVTGFVHVYLAVKVYFIVTNSIWVGLYESEAQKSLSNYHSFFDSTGVSQYYGSYYDPCSIYGGASVGVWASLFALGILPSPYLYLTLRFYAAQLQIQDMLKKRQERDQQQQPTTVVHVYGSNQAEPAQYNMVQTPNN
ncbi:16444_t:CDS:2 [Cetraspora pellucida]|uniref:16444_t:CDS:1 n=1 Tax=Cetraspora pellucida TaxID=1433469 RepID=A0A9N9NAA5_9GLOM|nr:16444_t:CDS:2 [Cetraspora pellucida]